MNTHDDVIKAQVEEVLSTSMHNSSLGINVQVEKGYVTLHGVVDVLAEKIAAADIVKQVNGIRGLDNSLTVGADRFFEDDKINEQVTNKLINEPQLDPKSVGAETYRGNVTLVGRVKTLAEKQIAMKLAASVPGVKDIMSALKIGEGIEEPTDDATLVNEVERAFAASGEVRAEEIETTCSNGVIKLVGTVDNLNQKMLAERLSGTVPGVRRIINTLTTRHGESESDRVLTNLARKALNQAHHVSPAQVKVYVIGSTAYLSGDVFTIDAKEAAEKVVAQIEGIHQVMNDIQVVTH